MTEAQVTPEELYKSENYSLYEFPLNKDCSIFLALHGEGAPPDEGWNTWVNKARQKKKKLIIVYSPTTSGGPSSRQREEVASVLDKTYRLALLSDSKVVRGILTFLNWATGSSEYTKTFGTGEIKRAFQFLNEDSEKIPIGVQEACQDLIEMMVKRAA